MEHALWWFRQLHTHLLQTPRPCNILGIKNGVGWSVTYDYTSVNCSVHLLFCSDFLDWIKQASVTFLFFFESQHSQYMLKPERFQDISKVGHRFFCSTLPGLQPQLWILTSWIMAGGLNNLCLIVEDGRWLALGCCVSVCGEVFVRLPQQCLEHPSPSPALWYPTRSHREVSAGGNQRGWSFHRTQCELQRSCGLK